MLLLAGMPVSQTWIPATWPARTSGARAEQTSRVHYVCLGYVRNVPAQRRHTAAAALQAARRGGRAHRLDSIKQRMRSPWWAFLNHEDIVDSACHKEYIVLSREQALQATRLMLQGMDMSRTEWQARTMPAGVQPDEHLSDGLRQAARSMIAPVGA